jgi:hypothetical protein
MEKRGASSKSSLFLLEMIIAILFLAVAATVCMRLFVQARLTGAASENLARAVMVAQNITENLKAAPDPEEWLTGASGTDSPQPGELWEFRYDADWRLLAANDTESTPVFWLNVRQITAERGLWLAETTVCASNSAEPLFVLPCAVYLPPERRSP